MILEASPPNTDVGGKGGYEVCVGRQNHIGGWLSPKALGTRDLPLQLTHTSPLLIFLEHGRFTLCLAGLFLRCPTFGGSIVDSMGGPGGHLTPLLHLCLSAPFSTLHLREVTIRGQVHLKLLLLGSGDPPFPFLPESALWLLLEAG